jgi:hypothetical protein
VAIDLSEDQYIDSLKRAVTPLWATAPTTVSPAQWLGYLTDAFWQAKLDGFLTGFIEEDGEIEHEDTGADPDRKYVALVILYAAINILSLRILSTNTGFRAKAGPVEFEQQNSATMLAEMLKQLRASKDRILDELDELEQTSVLYLDALSVRTFDAPSYWGSIELTG